MQQNGARLPVDEDLEDDALGGGEDAEEKQSLLFQHTSKRQMCPGDLEDWGAGTRRGSDQGAEISIWTDLLEIFQIAVPTALGNLSEFLPITFAMSMVGQLPGNGLQLDTLAMANSYWNMTGLAVQYGLNSAVRTLSAQAVGSGRGREQGGVHVQRGVIIALVAMIPSFLNCPVAFLS